LRRLASVSQLGTSWYKQCIDPSQGGQGKGESMTQEPTYHKSKLSPRVHPDDRSRIDGLNAIATVLYGEPQPQRSISYYTPILIQCTLPYIDPKTVAWKKTNGDFSLIVSSGFDQNLEPYGIPYGSLPRLVLAYIITRVIQTGERRIDLSSYFSTFLKEIGYTGNLKGNSRQAKTVRNQIIRLVRASIAFEGRGGTDEAGRLAGINMNVASKYDLWWDFKSPEQDSLWGSYIQISEEFRQAIFSAPVPLRANILKALHKSPLALDVYMWVSYRLFTMRATGQESITLGYRRLQEQFGTSTAEGNYRSFRQEFRAAFGKVAGYWRDDDSEKSRLNYDMNTTGLTLYRSPLLIAKPKMSRSQEDAHRILMSRNFDQETRRSARQLAGQWDVDYLTSQYFDWIAQEGVTPKNPRAHFLDFIKTHRARHGETI
jgi:hypothetical protein